MKKIAATCSLIVLKLLFHSPDCAEAHKGPARICEEQHTPAPPPQVIPHQPPPIAAVRPSPAPRHLLQPLIPAATTPRPSTTSAVVPPVVPVQPTARPINQPALLFEGSFDALEDADKNTVAYTIAQRALLSFWADSTNMLFLKHFYKEALGNNKYLWKKTTERWENFLNACQKHGGKKNGFPKIQQLSTKKIKQLLDPYCSGASALCQQFQNTSQVLKAQAWREKLWKDLPQFYALLQGNKTLKAALQERQKPIKTWITQDPERAFSIYRTLGHTVHGLGGNLDNVLQNYVAAAEQEKVLDYMEELAKNDKSMSEKAHFQAALPGAKKVRERIEEEAESAQGGA